MDLKDLIKLYRRWFWLLLAGLLLGMGSGYAASSIQKPVYEASTKVLVTRVKQQGSTDILSISDSQLVLTYLQLLKTRPVLDDVSSRVGTKVDSDNVKVDVIADTQIIQIKVQDANAHQSADIANGLVQVLIQQNEILQAGRYTAYEQGLNTQIAQVQNQISALQSQISEINEATIQKQLGTVNKQIADLQNQIAALDKDITGYTGSLDAAERASLTDKQSQLTQLRSLLSLYQEIQTNLVFLGKPSQGTGSTDLQVTSLQSTLTLYQQLYLNLLNNLEAVKLARAQSTPTVTKIEEAIVPEKPIRPIPILYTALSGMVGLLIAAGAVLLMDYMDDTLQSSQKIREALGLPVLAEIVHADKFDQESTDSRDRKTTPFFNSFGILRINVSRLMAQNSQKSILVTSGSLGEGKTTVAINLAAAFAKAKKRVVLIDADFYNPVINSQLKLDNQRGLTEILGNHTDWREVAKESRGIVVITSGKHPLASAVQLESNGMTQLLKSLQKEFDMIVIDAPPLFILDSQILCTQVGGILLVVRQANTTAAAVRTMLDQLKLLGVDVLGVVLNRVPRTGTYYHGGYYHHIHEENPEEIVDDIKASES